MHTRMFDQVQRAQRVCPNSHAGRHTSATLSCSSCWNGQGHGSSGMHGAHVQSRVQQASARVSEAQARLTTAENEAAAAERAAAAAQRAAAAAEQQRRQAEMLEERRRLQAGLQRQQRKRDAATQVRPAKQLPCHTQEMCRRLGPFDQSASEYRQAMPWPCTDTGTETLSWQTRHRRLPLKPTRTHRYFHVAGYTDSDCAAAHCPCPQQTGCIICQCIPPLACMQVDNINKARTRLKRTLDDQSPWLEAQPPQDPSTLPVLTFSPGSSIMDAAEAHADGTRAAGESQQCLVLKASAEAALPAACLAACTAVRPTTCWRCYTGSHWCVTASASGCIKSYSAGVQQSLSRPQSRL